MTFENTAAFAAALDEQDVFKAYSDRFYFPIINGEKSIYFLGNSLGLQPKTTQDYVLAELEDWASFGVEGYFMKADPWLDYQDHLTGPLSKIVGALPHEIVVMNQLSVNLHLMMASFYNPTARRYKIICEAKAFPSDQYVFASQARLAGYDPADAVVEVHPREGEECLRTEDILALIEQEKDAVALVLFSGVNYYTGQLFDMPAITKAAKDAGAMCGFDLAHAAGNVPLQLHEWGVDFACWCSYKYLNSGPGGIAGAYIHEKHASNKDLPRLAGWWGNEKSTRFLMNKTFDPSPTAAGWQISNAPVLSMAAHRAALDIFEEIKLDDYFTKGNDLQEYLCFVIKEVNKTLDGEDIKILTPQTSGAHGCQVSMVMPKDGKLTFDKLALHGVMADWREPDVIRIAAVPLYNSFSDVYAFGDILKHIMTQGK